MNRGTHCFYCGMPGQIICLTALETAWDMHVHQCGTRMYIARETGEIDDGRTRQSPACLRIVALQAEIEAIRNEKLALIAARDGEGPHDDDPY